jgi:hypothetical protein
LARPCHAAYNNRAACHTHLGAFSAAIVDAERCIALEPTWVKGFSRNRHTQCQKHRLTHRDSSCSIALLALGWCSSMMSYMMTIVTTRSAPPAASALSAPLTHLTACLRTSASG